MSNLQFFAEIRSRARRLLPGPIDQLNKTDLLRAVAQQSGAAEVLKLGHCVYELPETPVLRVLISGDSPNEVFDQWCRFERYCHTHNRCRRLDGAQSSADTLHIEHYALEDRPIDAVNHLFMWGVLIGVLRRAGFSGLSARVLPPTGHRGPALPGLAIYGDGQFRLQGHDIPSGAELELKWPSAARKDHEEANPPSSAGASVAAQLDALIQQRPEKAWKIEGAAQLLGMSKRSLQRKLSEESTTFSAACQNARIEAARALIRDTALNLTEIAFCAGFADLAHMSRQMRKQDSVPPSAYRDLVRGGRNY